MSKHHPPASLTRRADFLRASAQGSKWITPHFVLLALDSAEGEARVGYTVTKKLGNAVVRNRIRRRLREAIRLEGVKHLKPATDYVLIGRKDALLCPHETLIRDVRWALTRIHGAKHSGAKHKEKNEPRNPPPAAAPPADA